MATEWSLATALRSLFGLSQPVNRTTYALVGFGLMGLKYLVEFCVVAFLADQVLTPLDFINPTLTGRQRIAMQGPGWLGLAWVFWSIPFLWIAITLTVRRCIDAGIQPTMATCILIPIFNFLMMIALCFCPTREQSEALQAEALPEESTKNSTSRFYSALGGIGVAALYGTTLIQASALLESYGTVMFFGTPFVAGLAAAYIYNLREEHGVGSSMIVAFEAIVMISFALLLVAAEGIICILMAAPIMVPLGVLGGVVGRLLAARRRSIRKGMMLGCVALPLISLGESWLPDGETFVVTSSITINAPPEEVWDCVINFPEITAEPEWLFRLGIACPERARIEGQGVGAVRHCEFTTGTFVEPITAWDAPHRLAFEVTEQPEPMFELTPYRHVHPPHLTGSFRSTQGEFRLLELPDGSTRLEGSTWYQLKIYPHGYWTLWTDWLVHKIHLRVLRHIKETVEAG